MSELEKTYWWHIGKIYLVKDLVESLFPDRTVPLEIFELGCGTGGVTRALTEYGNVTGVDISDDAIELAKQTGLKNIFKADISDMDPAPYQGRFDLVLALDVLEHLQEDVDAMKKARLMLKAGGYFLVNVPAHKYLWSEHDEALHHKRRYHMLEITKKLKDAGFKIEKKSFFKVLPLT